MFIDLNIWEIKNVRLFSWKGGDTHIENEFLNGARTIFCNYRFETDKQDCRILIKSLASWNMFDNLKTEVNPSKFEIYLKAFEICWINLDNVGWTLES